jgi:hypothetical protein
VGRDIIPYLYALPGQRYDPDTTEAGTPSMNAFVVGTNEHVHLGVYIDRESDVAAARDVVASVRQE